MTDQLIKLAHEMSPDPDKREMDVLLATGENAASALIAMAINALGAKAVSLTGAEAGRFYGGSLSSQRGGGRVIAPAKLEISLEIPSQLIANRAKLPGIPLCPTYV